MASANVVEFTDSNFEAEISGSEVPVLVDLWAPWCGPCKLIAPVIDEIANETSGTAKVGKLNIDDHPATAAKYRVQAIPTFLIFKGGAMVEQITGMASKADLLAKLAA